MEGHQGVAETEPEWAGFSEHETISSDDNVNVADESPQAAIQVTSKSKLQKAPALRELIKAQNYMKDGLNASSEKKRKLTDDDNK